MTEYFEGIEDRRQQGKIIIADREVGITVKEISRILRVSQSAIYSITKKYRERGNLN